MTASRTCLDKICTPLMREKYIKKRIMYPSQNHVSKSQLAIFHSPFISECLHKAKLSFLFHAHCLKVFRLLTTNLLLNAIWVSATKHVAMAYLVWKSSCFNNMLSFTLHLHSLISIPMQMHQTETQAHVKSFTFRCIPNSSW